MVLTINYRRVAPPLSLAWNPIYTKRPMTFTAGGRMEIRELVRLKKGVGGLDPPNNLAILLDRFRERVSGRREVEKSWPGSRSSS